MWGHPIQAIEDLIINEIGDNLTLSVRVPYDLLRAQMGMFAIYNVKN